MTTKTKTDPALVTSIDDWAEAGVHTPLLLSGRRVKIRIPDLGDMVESGEIPQHLLDVALGVVNNETKVTKDLILKQKEFTAIIVRATVVEPKLETDEQVAKIPVEDKELLVSLATRQRDVDAEGEHLAGLNDSEKFRKFRGIGEFDKDVEGS